MRLVVATTLLLASCNVVELREPLEPPRRARAVAGVGEVRLEWETVPNATGYRIYYANARSVGPDTYVGLGGDVIQIERSPFTIGSLAPNQEVFFAISSIRGGVEAKPDTSLAATPLAGPLVHPTPAWIATGTSSSGFGTVIAAGDLDGDARSDLVVGAPDAFSGTGFIDIFYGSSAMASSSNVRILFGGSLRTGRALVVADANGDGYDDLFFSEPDDDAGNGHVHVKFGGPNGVNSPGTDATFSGSNGEGLGESIAVGDANGDGFLDLLAGARGPGGSNGAVYLYLGSATGFSATAQWSVTAESPGDGTGAAVALADFNGDGYDDVVIGEPSWNVDAGRVRVMFGSATVPSFLADTAYTGGAGYQLGTSVVGVGDLNGFGEEIAVGEKTIANNTGPSVYFFSHGSLDPYGRVDGAIGPAGSTMSVAAGDLTRDGRNDVLVGDPQEAGGLGRLYLYRSDALGSGLPVWTVDGQAAGDRFGGAVAVVPDVNGDGLVDLVATAPGAAGGTGRAAYWRGGVPRGIVADAGLPLMDWDNGNEDPTAATFDDPVPVGPWICQWEWFDEEVDPPIDPCTPQNAGAVSHTRETTDPATGWGRIRVRNVTDGRYGEAMVPLIQGTR